MSDLIEVRKISPVEAAGICDHTFLHRPECFRGQAEDPFAAYEKELEKFVEQTINLNPAPYAVCLRPEEVARVRGMLAQAGRSEIKIASVVGFPLGDLVATATKVREVLEVVEQGASEVDTVLCWRALKNGDTKRAADDLAAVVDAAHRHRVLVKVILEICELNDDQIRSACKICTQVGADFVKTSTGFGRGGATEKALRVMRESFAGGIKLAGGVNRDNLGDLLVAVIGEQVPRLDPLQVRIGESSLLSASPA